MKKINSIVEKIDYYSVMEINLLKYSDYPITLFDYLFLPFAFIWVYLRYKIIKD